MVEELVRFRLKVRQFALATGQATKEARRQALLERQPLLEACDTLRQDLAVHGISVKVSHCQRPSDNGPEMTTLRRCVNQLASHTHTGGPKLSPCEHRGPPCGESEEG